jgi:hypothetical protein
VPCPAHNKRIHLKPGTCGNNINVLGGSGDAIVGKLKMETIIKEYWALRKKAKDHCNNVSSTLSIQPHENPSGFYNMAFNDITVALELQDYYRKVWGKKTDTNCSSIEEARKQNAHRIIAIQKMVFIEILSAFEFSAKKFLFNTSHPVGNFNGRKYLRKIMLRSKDAGIINDADNQLWEGVIECRNCLVHNNGYSEINADYQYPKCTLNLETDKMIQGNLHVFTNLIGWILDASSSWIININSE